MTSNEGARRNTTTLTVVQDRCVGCGVCAGICPVQNLHMAWNADGQYVPVDAGQCVAQCHVCLEACPFLDHEANEDTLAAAAFGDVPGIRHDPVAGYWQTCQVGHVAVGEYRARGASGGLASWFLARLLEQGIVDHAACVVPQADAEHLFAFAVCSDPETVRQGARSAYYPVELSGVVQTILTTPGRYAIIGLPCFLKALRLAMAQQRRLRERVTVLAGLVCGQAKSRGLTEYLIRRMGEDPGAVESISFREKLADRPASDFAFAVRTGGVAHQLPWSEGYGEAWRTGQFKLAACDYCDDIFAEVADITFLDAWLAPYATDSQGTSIVVTRSAVATALLADGIARGELALEPLPIDKAVGSQRGVVRNKRDALAHRLWLMARQGELPPRKRVEPRRPGWFAQARIRAYEELRRGSHAGLRAQREAGTAGLEIYLAHVDRAWQRVARFERIAHWMQWAKSAVAALRR